MPNRHQGLPAHDQQVAQVFEREVFEEPDDWAVGQPMQQHQEIADAPPRQPGAIAVNPRNGLRQTITYGKPAFYSTELSILRKELLVTAAKIMSNRADKTDQDV